MKLSKAAWPASPFGEPKVALRIIAMAKNAANMKYTKASVMPSPAPAKLAVHHSPKMSSMNTLKNIFGAFSLLSGLKKLHTKLRRIG